MTSLLHTDWLCCLLCSATSGDKEYSLCSLHSVPLIFSLSTAAGTEALANMKPETARNLNPTFLQQFNLTCSLKSLQHLSRPRHTTELFLKYSQIIFEKV
jgi:hypothetical protein